jgi:Cellulase (glycosyl hydrolase family 5)
MTLAPVTLNGNYFTKNGRRFLPIGAHWVPARTGLGWPVEWDEADLEADFAKMADLGFNTVRFDLFWAWFEPRPGDYNPEAFRQLDVFIRLAHQYAIYLHPTLFIGGEVGEAFWDLPWRQGRHPHADPEMLRLQTDHAAEFARRYRKEPAILAWDLTDEPPFWIVGNQTTDAMAINWTRLVAGALRRSDPAHLLCVGTSMEDINHGPFRPDNLAAEMDFFSVHPYSIYTPDRFPDPMLSERGTYAGAFETTLSLGAGRPVMIHEFGASSAQYDPERIAAFDRVTFYSGLAAGACGFLPWCYTDAAPDLFRRAPYLLAPHETQFGLTTWDRQDRPRGRVLREFSRLLGQLDLSDLQPAPGEAALIVPHEWAKPHGDMSRAGLAQAGGLPYTSTQDGNETGEANLWLTRSLLNSFILARRAGLKVDMPREYSDWQAHPLLMLPSPLTGTERNLVHVHTAFWETARAYVDQGGTLYASLCADAAIPGMADLFGASLSDHAPAEEVILKLVEPFGSLPAGTEFHFQADPSNGRHWPATLDMASGKVVAVDGLGRPALVSNLYGHGRTLLSVYPLESYLALRPAAFDGPEGTHLLYHALAEWAGIQPMFSTNVPSVEAAGLVAGQRGYAVLANHSPEQKQVTVVSNLPMKEVNRITSQDRQPLSLQDHAWRMDIAAYDGAVVEWKL